MAGGGEGGREPVKDDYGSVITMVTAGSKDTLHPEETTCRNRFLKGVSTILKESC